jgi:hypothetical protein
MPNWKELLEEIKGVGSESPHDVVRRRHLKKLHQITKRNVIAYYSGFLQKPGIDGSSINDDDKNGLMTTVHKLDRSKGLDLIIHTEGGSAAAVESLVDYLRKMFGTDMRAIVPQLAMSGGTMIACACKSIIMGKQSNLGPIDPQFGGRPAHGVIEEFKKAYEECKIDVNKIPIWQPIIANYPPTLIGECQKAIQWTETLVKDWLRTGMLAGDPQADAKANKIYEELGDHALNLSHGRHLAIEKCEEMGLKIEHLEESEALQDAVLSVHHAFMHTLSSTGAFKIIENHKGTAFVKQAIQQLVLGQGP